MGYGFSVECSNCGFTKHFTLGTGFGDSSLELIAETLHYTLKRKVKEIMDNHPVGGYEFDRILVNCAHCNKLTEKEYIKIRYDKRKIFENGLTCSKCKKLLEVIDESTLLDGINCPDSREKTLRKSDELLWD